MATNQRANLPDYVENNLELLAVPLKPQVNLQYKVFFDPAPTNIQVWGTDRYEVTYQWDYEGKTLSESRWQSTDADQKVGPPAVQVMGALASHRVYSPDEVKELYKQGPVKRDF